MPLTETIHGYQILATFHTKGEPGIVRDGRVILVDKGEQQKRQRYVTAWQGWNSVPYLEGGWDREWSQGNYLSNFQDAWKDFIYRCERWIGK